MTAYMDEFADMLSDTVDIQPGYIDEYGVFIPSGDVFSPTCRIMGEVKKITSSEGKEVVSSVQLILDDTYGVDAVSYRYTLPSRFNPRSSLVAHAVTHVTDESGPLYEKVWLP